MKQALNIQDHKPSTLRRLKRLQWRDAALLFAVACLTLVCLSMIAIDVRQLRDEQQRVNEMIGLAENALTLSAKGHQVEQAKSMWLFALLSHDAASSRIQVANAAYKSALSEFEFSFNGLATSAATDPWTQELLKILRRESDLNASLYSELYRVLGDLGEVESQKLNLARERLATDGARLSESVSALIQTLSLNFSRQAKKIQAEGVERSRELRLRLGALMVAALALMGMLGWYLQRTRRSVQGEMNLLEQEALTDPLTAMPNVRAFKIHLKKAMEKSRRKSDLLTLVLIDIDHFKAFNDKYGHPAGDRLLTQASSLWSALLPDNASLSRIGGEEFALILPGKSSVEAEALVSRLLIATPEQQTFSAGLALYTPGETSESFIARADKALYRAKAAGRNRITGEACPSRSTLSTAEYIH